MSQLFDDFKRIDSTPMRASWSPTGHICPECQRPLTPEWKGKHREGCVIATWDLGRVVAHPDSGERLLGALEQEVADEL